MKLKGSHRCFHCTRPRHTAKICKASIRCKICRKRHATSMCRGKELAAQGTAAIQGKNENREEQRSTCQYTNISSSIFLQTAMAIALGGNKSCYCRILLDTGSQRTFILKSLSKKFGCTVKGKERRDCRLFRRRTRGKDYAFS